MEVDEKWGTSLSGKEEWGRSVRHGGGRICSGFGRGDCEAEREDLTEELRLIKERWQASCRWPVLW